MRISEAISAASMLQVQNAWLTQVEAKPTVRACVLLESD
jgi:hypothetical protein